MLSALTSTAAASTSLLCGSITRTRIDERGFLSPTVPLTVIVSPLVKLEPFRVAVNPPSDCTCCCALIIVKLEAKIIKVIVAVNVIVIVGEADTGEDILIMPRRRKRPQIKIRLCLIILSNNIPLTTSKSSR